MILDKCECYHLRHYADPPKSVILDNKIVTTYGNIISVGECWGTKECEECTCEGDPNKCDFYPEKRKENKAMEENKALTTAEMWLQAQEDGRRYIAGDKTYSRDEGFLYLGKDISFENWKYNFNCFMNVNNWIKDPNVLTISEAEKKFGIKIIED